MLVLLAPSQNISKTEKEFPRWPWEGRQSHTEEFGRIYETGHSGADRDNADGGFPIPLGVFVFLKQVAADAALWGG